MPELRTTTLVDAPPRTVAAALLDAPLLTRAVRGLGVRLTSDGPVLHEGATLTAAAGPVTGVLRVTRADTTGLSAELVAGPLPRLALATDLRHTGGGTVVVDRVEWTSPGGPVGRFADVVVGRGLALRVLEARATAVSRRSRELLDARVVVAAAVVHDGRLLVQQRAYPADAAGRWELPGGRVEPGESDHDAVTRECAEELAVTVEPTTQVGPDVPLRADLVLRAYAARLLSGTPTPTDHQATRWITAADLATLDWLPADRALLPALHPLLPGVVPPGRASRTSRSRESYVQEP
ncbi:NUDIX domain-containing protein [Saccharothrix yanglingensis]|uniref:8-oxo-dGTP diphosphatase n=1 Tax=Saccharothrix yanglingensis TaxID=659496 RepID=A0ABU0WZH7_9PSEU|nr:NUDIX domain-containing protein [Saccharothrix yanglingensis]MDQ2584747.1 NUDIX hydrolase [Saccharothrix yanglingensis]